MFFTTKTGSVYVVNTEKRTISGGPLANEPLRAIPDLIVGTRAVVTLADGRTLKTSTIQKIHR